VAFYMIRELEQLLLKIFHPVPIRLNVGTRFEASLLRKEISFRNLKKYNTYVMFHTAGLSVGKISVNTYVELILF
jgi:hypothetical protein